MSQYITLEIGKTYIIHTTKPSTVIFKFVNLGEYIVNGQLVRVAHHSDLASPYAIESGPFEQP